MGAIKASLVVLLAIFGSAYWDVRVHDNDFSKSNLGQMLKTYGGYEYGLLTYEYTVDTARWMRAKAPEYWVSFKEAAAPYNRLLRDLSVVTYNMTCKVYSNVASTVGEHYPVVQDWYVYYFGFCMLPGPIAGVVQGHSLILHMHSLISHTMVKKNLPGLRDASYNAAVKFLGAAKNSTENAAEYLQKNVFVGSWSPDNMKKVTLEAYNTTQQYASSTLSWIYDTISSQKASTRN